MKEEELLQERLEQLESGAPLEACQSGLPKDVGELLGLAAEMRQVGFPARDSSTVHAQRARLLEHAGKEREMNANLFRQKIQARWQSVRNWLRVRPLPGLSWLSWAALLLIVVALVAAGGIAAAVLGSRGGPANAATATLQELGGLVQVQARDGTWQEAQKEARVATGQRVRTGELSHATLTLADGSRVLLNAGTELSIDRSETSAAGQRDTILLTQWSGTTNHEVAASQDTAARYVVRTPSGNAEAHGTTFQVAVSPDLFARFDVDAGAIEVTNRGSTVLVLAGQSTLVNVNQAPAAPVFRISGEGEVIQVGPTWIIAEQIFQVTTATVIIGNPQLGDWVSVQGRLFPDNTRVADLIVLLHPSPINRFTLNGQVETIGEAAWIVAGQTISVTAETLIDDTILVGDVVRVDGTILPGGKLVAGSIHLVEEGPGWPFDFVGVVQDITAETWTISGVAIAVDLQTVIEPGLVVGDLVQVEGRIQSGGDWLARSIERAEGDEREFELTGQVGSMDPWVVAGIAFETRDWTRIDPGIAVGTIVHVEGQVLEDGTWVANSIERVEDGEPGFQVVLVGTVTGMGPWSVSGIPFVVDDTTTIVGEVAIGSLVRVEIVILPDGTWLARSIVVFDVNLGLGCWVISGVVLSVDDNFIQLQGWPPISPTGLYIEGDLEVNSFVLVMVCFNHDGTMTILAIIVIHEPGEIIIPGPVLPPEEGGEDKVTVCHKPNGKNPHSITISRSALPAHLGHGDTVGPCE